MLNLEGDLDELIGWCEDFLRERAHAMNDEFDDVAKMPLEELPLHINDGDLTAEFCVARLAGREYDTWENWIRALSNNEFDTDEFKAFGRNDGKLLVIEHLYRALGKEDKAQHAHDLQYDV